LQKWYNPDISGNFVVTMPNNKKQALILFVRTKTGVVGVYKQQNNKQN
jgi:hypothetical protein